MTSLLPSILILGLAALVSLILAFRRTSPSEFAAERDSASRALTVATVIQTGHFAEEWATGFHERFPALFDLEPMPLWFFVAFNLAWIVLWIASVPLLRLARRMAFFAAWFLAIAGCLNGLTHPIMAIMSGGYFPGLFTSPFIGLAGVWLWRRLQDATSASADV